MLNKIICFFIFLFSPIFLFSQNKQVKIKEDIKTSTITINSNNTITNKDDYKDEESEVMVDKMDYDNNNFPEYYNQLNKDNKTEESQNTIPLEYGSLKGIFSESGKNIFVFENENGIIFLLNISINKKNEIKIDLINKIERN